MCVEVIMFYISVVCLRCSVCYNYCDSLMMMCRVYWCIDMDEMVIWSNVVLLLAVIPWLFYAMILLIFSLSILYGSVSVDLAANLTN